jgi:hypothetical protein
MKRPSGTAPHARDSSPEGGRFETADSRSFEAADSNFAADGTPMNADSRITEFLFRAHPRRCSAQDQFKRIRSVSAFIGGFKTVALDPD